jgi:O-acetyl-ADP-ribose deacetylase (regulator of RNase III)
MAEKRRRTRSMNIVSGTIFDDDADILVVPVNCVGIMGGGLAHQFKERYPWLDEDYRWLCTDGSLKPGETAYTSDGTRNIVLAATKDDYKDPSKIVWIEGICAEIALFLKIGWPGEVRDDDAIPSIAIPALGCGLGGLEWEKVLPIIERNLSEFDARIYTPSYRYPDTRGES